MDHFVGSVQFPLVAASQLDGVAAAQTVGTAATANIAASFRLFRFMTPPDWCWYDVVTVKHVPDELLQQIVQRLVEALHPLEIYLFGSHASGKTHAHSDIDLLIVMPDDVANLHYLSGRAYSSLPDRPTPVDLILMRRSDVQKWGPVKFSLAYEATRKGKLLYGAAASTRATVA